MNILSPEYLGIVMPFIIALVMVGVPGSISFIDMLIKRKERKAKEKLEDRKSDAEVGQVTATVADTQVGTSLELLNEMKEQYKEIKAQNIELKKQYEEILVQVREMDETIVDIKILNATCAVEISELKQSEITNKEIIKKLSFEQLVSAALNAHMYTVINIYLKQMREAEITPACDLKTREEIAEELLVTERRKNELIKERRF